MVVIVKDEYLIFEIDYNKICFFREEMMRCFKEVYDKVKAEGIIIYKCIKFKSFNEFLYGVLCG